MDAHARDVARACTRASDDEAINFPEVVERLMEIGVERYHADLQRAEKVYYMPDGSSERVECRPLAAIPADPFSASGVEAAVRAVQAGTIRYNAFCERIAEAGCVGYFVTLAGRCAVYYGRGMETHVERFPQPR